MRRKRIVIIIGIVIFLLVAAGTISYYFSSEKKSPELKEKPPERVSSASLKKTIITPHMEQAIIKGKNILYCSTFQLAWNELKDGIVKEDIKMTDEPPMVKILNKGLSTKVDLSEKDYVAMAGFGKDNIVEKINKELTKKFKNEATPVESIPPDGLMIYSFLYTNLEFKKEFESIIEPFPFHSNSQIFKVKAFGINECATPECTRSHEKYIKQVDVLYYPGIEIYDMKPESIQFVIRLNTKDPKDEIILAKIKPEETIQKTVEAVNKLIKNGKPEAFSTIDALNIPKFLFDIEHAYEPLLGKLLQNKGVTGFPITRATQTIMFKLDEKGAMVKSTSNVVAVAIPKQLIFNRPFLIYLKKKDGKWPYFAMWVDNPELMEKLSVEAERRKMTGTTEEAPAVKKRGMEKPPESPVRLPTFRNNLGMNFVLIPAGTFTMGSPSNESQWLNNEKQHQATISKPFYMQTTEVTQSQWKKVMGSNPSDLRIVVMPAPSNPVQMVSWDNVQDFINKLNQQEGTDKYRLPTEAEWEYAARAGTKTVYSFGNSEDELGAYAWYDKNSDGKTHPVGRKRPNNWGLYDMYGNVEEWVQDLYRYYPSDSIANPMERVKDWFRNLSSGIETDPALGYCRVYRGGGSGSGAFGCRSATRGYGGLLGYYTGFRLVRTP